MVEKCVFGTIMKACDTFILNTRSLIYGFDTNAVEGYHSYVAKAMGGKRINYWAEKSYESRAKFVLIQPNSKQAHHKLQKFTSKITKTEILVQKDLIKTKGKFISSFKLFRVGTVC